MKWDCYILCLAWNETWFGWLVEYCMELWCFKITCGSGVRNMDVVWVRRNFMKLLAIFHGSVVSVCLDIGDV